MISFVYRSNSLDSHTWYAGKMSAAAYAEWIKITTVTVIWAERI